MNTILQERCSYYERYAVTPSAAAKELYYYLQWAGHFICKPDFFIQREGFQSMLLLQTLRGTGTLYYQNQQITLEPGSFVLIDCMLSHIYYPKDGGTWEFRFLHFTGNRSFELSRHLCSVAGSVSFRVTPQIESCMLQCLNCCKEDTVVNEVHISKAISDLLYATALELQQAETGKMDEVCQYIRGNHARELTTAFLAEKFRFSRSYFSLQFKKYTGTTLHDYLLVCRLYQAKQLLSEGTLSVSQIGERVGFQDTGTFIRAFRRKEKCTPLQYRKQFGS